MNGTTNLNEFLPIRVIKVGIQYLLLMHQGYPLKALGDVIQGGP